MISESMKAKIKGHCLEIIGLCYESKPDPLKILNSAIALANTNAALAREWAAGIAEAESELEGEMPDENWLLAQKIRLEDHLRVTVRTTKENIARKIREGNASEEKD